MPNPIARLAAFNPLTYASDLFRWIVELRTVTLSDPFISILALGVFIATFNIIGVLMYERALEGGGWR
jgi:hypothetical protein